MQSSVSLDLFALPRIRGGAVQNCGCPASLAVRGSSKKIALRQNRKVFPFLLPPFMGGSYFRTLFWPTELSRATSAVSRSDVAVVRVFIFYSPPAHSAPWSMPRCFRFSLRSVQTLHHLFPKLPRYNLRTVQSRVAALADKHGLTYHLYSFLQANVKTYLAMRETAHKVGSVGRVVRSSQTRFRFPPFGREG